MKILYSIVISLLFSFSNSLIGQTTFNYTGSMQTYIVPGGVTLVNVEAWGAQGGVGYSGTGGLGGYAAGELAVTPGQTLYIYVGGMGGSPTAGWNGGGSGVNATNEGGGGGGASDVRAGGTALTDRVIVAGGGGGACFGDGGYGGGLIGGGGSTGGQGVWATGGTQTTGGIGGLYNNGSCAPGNSAFDGTLGIGGNGVGGGGSCGSYGGSGGGGGYYGGGGMQINGAGGGSSYYGALGNATTIENTQTGNGMIVITELVNCIPSSIVVDNFILIDLQGQCSVNAPVVYPTATNDCGTVITGVPNLTFPITAQGSTIITWTFNDGQGNTASQTQSALIFDSTDPVPDSPVLTEKQDCYQVTLNSPSATDNCAGTILGVPDVTFPITTIGSTIVTWTYDDGNGNVTTQQQNVVIDPIDLTVSVVDVLLTSNESGATYQWLDCDNGYTPINGQTNQSFASGVTGNFAVEITSALCVDTSECVFVDYTDLDEVESSDFSLYPNPIRDGYFKIKHDQEITSIEIIDMLGRVVMFVSEYNSNKIDVSSLLAGKYLVKIYANDMVKSQPLILLK